MAGSGWAFNQGEMAQAVQGFEECAAGARRTMSTLEAELQSAIAGRMAGQHVDALHRLHARIQDDMRTVNAALDEMSTRVNETKNKYNTNDAEASGLYAKLIGQVG
jgi:uncharacterized protein YukE